MVMQTSKLHEWIEEESKFMRALPVGNYPAEEMANTPYIAKEEEDTKERTNKRILIEAQWYEINNMISAFKMDLKKLSVQEIARYGLEGSIIDCAVALKKYRQTIENKVVRSHSVIQGYFKDANAYTKFLSDAVNLEDIETQYVLDSTQEAATARLMIQGHDAEQGRVFDTVLQAIEGCRKKLSKGVEVVTSQARQLKQDHDAKTEQVTKKLQNIISEDKEAIGNKKINIERQIQNFYDSIAKIINNKLPASQKLSAKLEDEKDRMQLVGSLRQVYQADQKVQKSRVLVRSQVFGLFVLCLLIGGIACLAYYAYEAHIKPVHFGVAIGLISLSVVGLLVNQFYVWKALRKNIVQTVSSRNLSSASVAETQQNSSYRLGNEGLSPAVA